MVKKLGSLLFVLLIATTAPFIAAFAANGFNGLIKSADPHGYYLWICIHHIIQGFLGIVLLKILFKNRLSNLGFNLRNRKIGFAILKWFFIVWSLIVIVFFILCGFFMKGFTQYIAQLYPLEKELIISKFIVELLLIIALGEEPIFRAFIAMQLERQWSEKIKIGKLSVSYVVIISAIIFMLSHINYDLVPFRIIYIDPIKLLLNLVFGLFLALLFEKTRSVFYTAIAHAYSNSLIYTLGFITAFLTK